MAATAGKLNTPPLRLFFALWPDRALQGRMAAVAAPMQRQCGGRRVVAPLLHITLAFLGDTAPERVADLQGLAAGIAVTPFILRLTQAGVWPRSGIGWLAPSECPPPLLALVQQLNAALGQAGFPVERRPYRPHITVLRKAVRAPADPVAVDIDWPVAGFALLQSTLGKHGPEYRVLAAWPGQP